MPVGQIAIYLNHHKDATKKPRLNTTCQDSVRSGRKGCGRPIHVYITLKNEKPFPLDSEPILVGAPYTREDGAVIAQIDSSNNHFLTCPTYVRPGSTPGPTTDFKAAAAKDVA